MTVRRWLRPPCAFLRCERLPLVLILVFLFAAVLLHAESERIFTARDSIEMTMFSDPSTRDFHAEAKISPNSRDVFIVTTKGEIKSNRLISSIWLYHVPQIQTFLRGGAGSTSPHPRLIHQAMAVPRAQQFDSYGSIITKSQWSSDSHSILFLQEGEGGVRRLMRLDIATGDARLVSERTQNVTDYAECSGVMVYVAESPTATVPPMDGRQVSVSMSGISLLNALDPKHYPVKDSVFRKNDLWAVREGRRFRINSVNGDEAWNYPISAANFLRLSISPKGDGLVAAIPAHEISDSWRDYRSMLKTFDFKTLSKTKPNGSEDFGWPWQYAYIDLRRNKVTPLFDAPSAWPSGYGDVVMAIWADDGRRVIVTNTYLPQQAELADPHKPCAAAVYLVTTATVQCVTPTWYPEISSHLKLATFDDATGDIVLSWESQGHLTVSRYHESKDRWREAESKEQRLSPVHPVRVFVHQALNEPPSLWAEDTATKTQRLLWDPNPQLKAKDLGRATIFRWRDRSGYEWKAGLLQPSGYVKGTRYPLVIQTHGFEEREFLLDGAYTTGFAAQALASAGFFVLQMESRRDRNLLPAGTEATAFADGCADGIEALLTSDLIDPSRIGIIGFSRTAWYIETMLERYPNRFRAASIIDGVDQGYVTYSLFCASIASCKLDHEASNGGEPFGDGLPNWVSNAASFNVHKIVTPVRIEAIGWDSLLAEWELYSSLLLQHKDVELFYIPNGQHILQQPEQRLASQDGTVTWFRQHLSSTN